MPKISETINEKMEEARKAEEANLQKKAESKPEKEEMNLSVIEQEVIKAKNHIRTVVEECKGIVPDNSNLANDYATIIASKFYTDWKKEDSFVSLDAMKDPFFKSRERLTNDTSFKNVMKEGKPENLWKTALDDSVEKFMDAFRLEEKRIKREKMKEATKETDAKKIEAKNRVEEKQKLVKEQVPSKKITKEMENVNGFFSSKIKDAQEKIKEVVKENNGMVDNYLLTEHYATIISASRERKEMMDSNNLKPIDSNGMIIISPYDPRFFDPRFPINRFNVGCIVVKHTQWFKTVIEKGNEILLHSAALKDDGSSLMSVFQMEDDRINGKDVNLLEEKISKAQASINSAVSKNSGKVPDNKKLKKEYATIAAVTMLKSLKSENPYRYFDESDVQSACSEFLKLGAFTQAMTNCPKDILKDAACKEKGGNLFDVIITYAPKNDEINLNNNSKISVVEHANEKAGECKVF